MSDVWGPLNGVDPNALPGQPGSIYGVDPTYDAAQIAALGDIGNLPPQAQPAAVQQFFGYDPATMQQVNTLFQRPQPDSGNMGAFNSEVAGIGGNNGQPITPGSGGGSGIDWNAVQQDQQRGGGSGGDVGGLNSPSGGAPNMGISYPDLSFGNGGDLTDLSPRGSLPGWLIARIPQMLAAKSKGEYRQYGGYYSPNYWYDIYNGYYIPPPNGGGDLQAYWRTVMNTPSIDPGGGISKMNLDRFGRFTTPYQVS